MRPVLGLGLLGAAGFISGHLVMNHNPAGRLRSWKHPAASSGMELATRIEAVTPIERSDGSGPSGRESDVKLGEVRSTAADRANDSGVVEAGISAPAPLTSAPAPAKPAPPAASASETSAANEAGHSDRPFVVVASGDTLGEIALRHLGSVYSVRSLMRLNPHITDPARVYPGELVYLPPPSTASSKPNNSDDSDVE